MRVGIIGVGVVGGTLKRWFEEHTKHELKCFDPNKNLTDSLEGCEYIFVCVPFSIKRLQYESILGDGDYVLKQSVIRARKESPSAKIFIRSTVIPGTNDELGTIAMPEFLTERRAYEDMCELPLMVGDGEKLPPDEAHDKVREYAELFPGKKIFYARNIDCELAKMTHNCFGALKVTYFNMIRDFCDGQGADFETVKHLANITGFLGTEHMQVPGPDGKRGFGGKCFPENIEAMEYYARKLNPNAVAIKLFETIQEMNTVYRVLK